MSSVPEFQHLPQFIPKPEADGLLNVLTVGGSDPLPWKPYQWSKNVSLKQLVYEYDNEQRAKHKHAVLDQLVGMIESNFETRIVNVWCNFFRDSKDMIEWHQDQYGFSLYVLSLGASRPVQVRPKKRGMFAKNKKEDVETHIQQHGDLYRWTHDYDMSHEHRVPPAESDGERISILFLGHPVGSNADPERLQTKRLHPVYSGQCDKCDGFLEQPNMKSYNPKRKCQECGHKFSYPMWD